MSVAVGDLCITKYNYEKIISLIDEFGPDDVESSARCSFFKYLKKAKKVDSVKIPPDCVTMNSTLVLTDLGNAQKITISLVFPKDENIKKGKISVLSPEGSGMLGSRVGSIVKWDTVKGEKYYQVSKVLYQPEAAGRYNQ